jgi:glycosyltransferase involved in cell wall biosynthesis
MAKYRILLDCHTFDAGPQGTSSFLSGITNKLIACATRREIDVELHCAAGYKTNIDKYITVPYVYHKIAGGFVARNLLSIPLLSFRIKSDYVVSQYVRPLVTHGETIVVMHDVLFIDFPRLFGFLYRLTRTFLFFLSAKTADHAVTVSNYSRQRIATCFGLDARQILVIPNGVTPPGSVRTTTGSPGTLLFLSVSRLERRKRHEWSIRAVEDLRYRGFDARLVIVGCGGGPYSDFVRDEARRVNDSFPDSVSIVNSLSGSDLDNLYLCSSVFLFPSEAEGFGIPVIEAASRGLPCVVADNTALRELSGYYVGSSFMSDSLDDFLRAINQIANNYSKYKLDAAAAAATVASTFSWERSSQMIVDQILVDRA